MPATESRGSRAGLRLRQALVALVGGTLCLLMVFLGLWQMQVFESQRAQTTEKRAAMPAVALEENLDGDSTMPLYGRPVEVSGTYLPQHQVLVGEQAPRRVVTAFRTSGGRTLAVVRGDSSTSTPPKPPSGTQQVRGIILPSETGGAGSSTGTFPTLRLDQLAQHWPAPLLDGYVTLDVAQQSAQGLQASPPHIPDTNGGRVRNQGYAMQWWAFAAFGAVVTGVAVRGMGRSATRD